MKCALELGVTIMLLMCTMTTMAFTFPVRNSLLLRTRLRGVFQTTSMSCCGLLLVPITSSYSYSSKKQFMSSTNDNDNDNIQRTIGDGSYMSEFEIKKSRFLGYTSHASNWEEAQNYITTIKELHPKGRHWCYGFVSGINPIQERCSDDGEPTGTAGLPILGAIKGEELSDTVCVVVRYFGGIKLGAGGLIRAYGAAARQVLREAPVDILIPKATFRITVDPQHVGTVYDAVGKVSGGVTSGEEYGTDGSLTVTVTCDLEFYDKLRVGLRDGTRGDAIFPDDDDDKQ